MHARPVRGFISPGFIALIVIAVLAAGAYYYANARNPAATTTSELASTTPSQPASAPQAPSGNASTPSATIDQSSLTVTGKTPVIRGTISGTSDMAVDVWKGTITPPPSLQLLASETGIAKPVWSTNTAVRVPEVTVSDGRWVTSIGNSKVAGNGGPNPYFAPGVYTVAVYGGAGSNLLTTGTLTVSAGDGAGFTASPMTGSAPLAVSFNTSGAAAQNGSIVFGDGASVQLLTLFGNGATNNAGYCGAGPDFFCSVPHTYVSVGTYTVTSRNASGAVLATQTIKVTP